MTGKKVTIERGIERNLTSKFKKLRKTRVGQLDLDTNKLLGRLDKLLKATGDSRYMESANLVGNNVNIKSKSIYNSLVEGYYELEKSIVDWENDKGILKCPGCNSKFGYILLRQHHCRLCGKVKCANCCGKMLEYNYLASIRQVSVYNHVLILKLNH